MKRNVQWSGTSQQEGSEPIGAVIAAMMPFFVIFLIAAMWRLG